jgi:sodium/proline symporter
VKVLTDPSMSVMGSLQASGGRRANWFGGATGSTVLLLLGTNLSCFFACLGGYPHLDVRLMAVQNESDRKTAIVVSSVWGVLTAIGEVLLGLVARTFHGSPSTFEANREIVLPYMISQHTLGILSVILFASTLAAMMSTADSQLVVASSAVAHDFYDKILNKGKDFSKDVQLRISRIGTLVVGAVGLGIAYFSENLVYALVSYSATGLLSVFMLKFTLLFFCADNFSKHGLIAAFLAGPITTIV